MWLLAGARDPFQLARFSRDVTHYEPGYPGLRRSLTLTEFLPPWPSFFVSLSCVLKGQQALGRVVGKAAVGTCTNLQNLHVMSMLRAIG